MWNKFKLNLRFSDGFRCRSWLTCWNLLSMKREIWTECLVEDLLKVIKMSQTKVQLSKQIPVLSQHRSSRRRCSVKKMLLKVLEISRKAFVLECIFDNIVDLQPLGCFVKKTFLKKFHRKTLLMLVMESLFQKVADLKTLLKRGSNTGVFLCSLQNF